MSCVGAGEKCCEPGLCDFYFSCGRNVCVHRGGAGQDMSHVQDVPARARGAIRVQPTLPFVSRTVLCARGTGEESDGPRVAETDRGCRVSPAWLKICRDEVHAG